MFKRCVLIYISSASAAEGRRASLLRSYSLLIMAICKGSESDTINVDLMRWEHLADLDGLYTEKQKGMLEGNNFDPLEYVLLFSAAFVNKAVGEKPLFYETRPYHLFRASASPKA